MNDQSQLIEISIRKIKVWEIRGSNWPARQKNRTCKHKLKSVNDQRRAFCNQRYDILYRVHLYDTLYTISLQLVEMDLSTYMWLAIIFS